MIADDKHAIVGGEERTRVSSEPFDLQCKSHDTPEDHHHGVDGRHGIRRVAGPYSTVALRRPEDSIVRHLLAKPNSHHVTSLQLTRRFAAET
jgi:hypothetical protein